MGMPFITGQVILREAGEKDGRQLCMLVGLLAVPPELAYQSEHQYRVLGFNNEQLTLDMESAIDRTEEARGQGLGALLRLPLWRI